MVRDRVMRPVRLLAVAVLAVVLVLSSAQNAFAAVELSYDDGSAEDTFWTPVAGYCYANRFVQGESNWLSGWSSVRVLTARFYVNSPFAGSRQVRVRVLDTAKNDLMTALTLTHPDPTVWWDVDLSAYDVVASGEFYLVWQQVDANTAGPGGDISGFKSRSYRGGSPTTWILDPNHDNFLIRAVVENATPASAPVGGVVMPANTFGILAPWLAVIAVVGCMGIVVVVGKKRRL